MIILRLAHGLHGEIHLSHSQRGTVRTRQRRCGRGSRRLLAEGCQRSTRWSRLFRGMSTCTLALLRLRVVLGLRSVAGGWCPQLVLAVGIHTQIPLATASSLPAPADLGLVAQSFAEFVAAVRKLARTTLSATPMTKFRAQTGLDEVWGGHQLILTVREPAMVSVAIASSIKHADLGLPHTRFALGCYAHAIGGHGSLSKRLGVLVLQYQSTTT
mmetsp:Transcript_12942/g.31161  ORF Transcript_12942/g.31161 Transcript_12942/m.31161 type:complete len:214 (-) Transcript_12942:2-643(-)